MVDLEEGEWILARGFWWKMAKPKEEKVEVPVDPPETMKVSWGATDTDPVVTGRAIRAIRVYSNVDGRQLRVMKTADAEDCLHIYVDVL